MAKRDQDVHFLASKEEVERIHQKMEKILGINGEGNSVALRRYNILAEMRNRLKKNGLIIHL